MKSCVIGAREAPNCCNNLVIVQQSKRLTHHFRLQELWHAGAGGGLSQKVIGLVKRMGSECSYCTRRSGTNPKQHETKVIIHDILTIAL